MEIIAALIVAVFFGFALHALWQHIAQLPTITTPARVDRHKVRINHYR